MERIFRIINMHKFKIIKRRKYEKDIYIWNRRNGL